jgi:hypothetical protein
MLDRQADISVMRIDQRLNQLGQLMIDRRRLRQFDRMASSNPNAKEAGDHDGGLETKKANLLCHIDGDQVGAFEAALSTRSEIGRVRPICML